MYYYMYYILYCATLWFYCTVVKCYVFSGLNTHLPIHYLGFIPSYHYYCYREPDGAHQGLSLPAEGRSDHLRIRAGPLPVHAV